MAEPTDDPAACSCKVGSAAAEFDLTEVHDDLDREWQRGDGPSVRELADRFNRRILEAAYRRAGTLPIEGELDNVYRVLTGDDADSADRTRARDRLRQDGIDVEPVEAAFVSHQTLYRHLVNCLDATYETPEKSTDERIEEWRTRLLALQSRTVDVTEQGITQLCSQDVLELGSFTVTADVAVSCEDCGRFYTVEELLDTRTCACKKPVSG